MAADEYKAFLHGFPFEERSLGASAAAVGGIEVTLLLVVDRYGIVAERTAGEVALIASGVLICSLVHEDSVSVERPLEGQDIAMTVAYEVGGANWATVNDQVVVSIAHPEEAGFRQGEGPICRRRDRGDPGSKCVEALSGSVRIGQRRIIELGDTAVWMGKQCGRPAHPRKMYCEHRSRSTIGKNCMALEEVRQHLAMVGR